MATKHELEEEIRKKQAEIESLQAELTGHNATRQKTERLIYPGTTCEFFERGLHHYIAARFCFSANLIPLVGNLFHHAVEMVMKSKLAESYTFEELQDKFRHKLQKSWRAILGLFPAERTLGDFQQTIRWLDRVEKLRYPDSIIKQGALIFTTLPTPEWKPGESINGLYAPPPAKLLEPSNPNGRPQYFLAGDDLDALMGLLFRLCHVGCSKHFSDLNQEAVRVLCWNNKEAVNWPLPANPRVSAATRPPSSPIS